MTESLKYVPTTCPYCGVGCGLNLVVKDDTTLVGVEPYKRTPVNEGKLCPKGMTCWEHVQKPERLTTPLIKKDGKFVEASWDEALDLIASKFSETYEKHGPKSLGFQVSCRTVNEDCYAMQKFARVAFKTNNVDNCARICHGPSVAGLSLSFGSGAATNPFEDVLNSDTIFMIGSNAVEAHPLAGRRIAQAKLKGIPIIVADPRFSPTARLADDWLRYNPSTHIALINSMMYWIIKENKHDKEFIEKRTKGFDELKAMVEKYADVEEITGVSPERVREFAMKYADAKNAVIIYCLGITEPDHRHGQRPLARKPLDALRQHRARGRRGQPAPRPEQRPGRLRHGRVPERLLRVPGRRGRGQPQEDGAGLGPARQVRCPTGTARPSPSRCGRPARRSRPCGSWR